MRYASLVGQLWQANRYLPTVEKRTYRGASFCNIAAHGLCHARLASIGSDEHRQKNLLSAVFRNGQIDFDNVFRRVDLIRQAAQELFDKGI